MTRFQLQSRIDNLVKMRGDDEAAHAEEDRIRSDFIHFVSTHKDVPGKLREMANLVLSTEKIEFERWCA